MADHFCVKLKLFFKNVALLRQSQTADARAQANASQRERNARNRSVDPVPVLNLAR